MAVAFQQLTSGGYRFNRTRLYARDHLPLDANPWHGGWLRLNTSFYNIDLKGPGWATALGGLASLPPWVSTALP